MITQKHGENSLRSERFVGPNYTQSVFTDPDPYQDP